MNNTKSILSSIVKTSGIYLNKVLGVFKTERHLSAPSQRRTDNDPPFYNLFPSALEREIVNCRIDISPSYKFVYFRIPKAANSTIVASLYHAETSIELTSQVEINKIKADHFLFPDQLNLEQVNEMMENYFKFTFTRNPYRRIISAYLDKIIRNKGGKRDSIAGFLLKPNGSDISFDEFLKYLEMGGINQNGHWARQIDLLPIPLDKFDFIGKIENLSVELPGVLYKLFNRDCKIITMREHATNAEDAYLNLNQDLYDRIYKIYEADFEYFKYPRIFNV